MKIMLVSELHFSNVSGYLRVLKILSEELCSKGHDVTILIPSGDNVNENVPKNANIVEIPSLPLPFYNELRMCLPDPRIIRIIHNSIPELIHLFQPTCLGVYAGLVANYLDIPMISSYHGNIDLYCDYYNMRLAKNFFVNTGKKIHNISNITLAPSKSTIYKLQNCGFKNVRLWGRGVDQTIFNPSFCKRDIFLDFGIDPNKPVMLYVGRVAKEKNLDLFIKLLERIPSAQIVIVGDGQYKTELEKRLKPLGNVYFTGYLHGKTLSQIYASSDIFIFPSKTETFGQVVLEAMSSELPVVGFLSDGVKDSITNEQTGYLAIDDTDWINYVQKLIDDENLRKSIGKNGLIQAEKKTWKTSLKQVINAYEELIKKYEFRQFIDIPNDTLKVRMFGKGKDVCFFHGFMGSWKDFAYYSELLSKKYRLCFFDLNEITTELYSREKNLKNLPNMILRLMDSNKIKPIAMIGFSLGSNLLWEIGKKQKDLRNKFILISPFYHSPLKAYVAKRLRFTRILHRLLNNPILSLKNIQFICNFQTQYKLNLFALNNMQQASLKLGKTAHNLFETIVKWPQIDFKTALESGSSIIYGEKDHFLNHFIKQNISLDSIEIIPYMGHSLYDNEDMLNNTIFKLIECRIAI